MVMYLPDRRHLDGMAIRPSAATVPAKESTPRVTEISSRCPIRAIHVPPPPENQIVRRVSPRAEADRYWHPL